MWWGRVENKGAADEGMRLVEGVPLIEGVCLAKGVPLKEGELLLEESGLLIQGLLLVEGVRLVEGEPLMLSECAMGVCWGVKSKLTFPTEEVTVEGLEDVEWVEGKEMEGIEGEGETEGDG